MAVVRDVTGKNCAEKCNIYEVITLSSDEEDSNGSTEEASYSFDRFILACRPHMTKESLDAARQKFKAAPKNLAHSQEIVDMLKRFTEQVSKNNAILYMDVVCKSLTKESEAKRSNYSSQNKLGGRRKSNDPCDVTQARDFKEGDELLANGIPEDIKSNKENGTGKVSDDDVDFVCEVRRKYKDEPSTSSVSAQQDLKLPKSGKISSKNLSKRQRKRLVVKLKRRLKEISQEIEILNKSELTLDEMDMADSNYMKENRLKKKFDRTWNKLCKIQGQPPNTGRVIEKRVRASSTGYSIIDKAVDKFLKDKHGKFPDYFDIRDVVLKANETHNLKMSPQLLNGIIQDVFTDIGNKLQRRRERDLIFNFGSHLLDDFKADEDPALFSEDLSKQLERNRRISKKKLKQVYAKYTHLERYGKARKRSASSASRCDSTGEKNEDNNSDGDVVNNLNSSSDATSTDEEQEVSRNEKEGSSDEDFFYSSATCSKSINHGTSTMSVPPENSQDSNGSYLSLGSDNDDTMDTSLQSPSDAGSGKTGWPTSLDFATEHGLHNKECETVGHVPSVLEKEDKSGTTSLYLSTNKCQCGSPAISSETSKHDAPVRSVSRTYIPISINHDATKSPVTTKDRMDKSTSVLKSDCEIIIDSPNEDHSTTDSSKICNVFNSSELNDVLSNGRCNPLVDSINLVTTSNGLAHNCVTPSKKRKASIDSVLQALKSKRLKAPNSGFKENSAQNQEVSKDPVTNTIVNGGNSLIVPNRKTQINMQHMQQFREKTLSAFKVSAYCMKDGKIGRSKLHFCSNIGHGTHSLSSESTQGETCSRTNSTGDCILQTERPEHEVIVIDD